MMSSNALRKEGNVVFLCQQDEDIEGKPKSEKPIKLKKDGTPKKISYNKKKGEKSEVYPFKIDDMKRVLRYFADNEMWIHYLMFVLSCNLGRRVSDTIKLKWSDIFYKTGEMRDDITIKEKKTDKHITLRLNIACRDGINLYVAKTGCDVSANNYENHVFLQVTGNFAGRVISSSAYLKALKKAGEELGIKYNIGTHSARKTFGMICKIIHPGDPYAMEIIQKLFNHSGVKVTNRYIGMEKQMMDAYFDDVGVFFREYALGDKEYRDSSNTPIVNLYTNDLRDMIEMAYWAGKSNASEADAEVHVDAISEIFEMVEVFKK